MVQTSVAQTSIYATVSVTSLSTRSTTVTSLATKTLVSVKTEHPTSYADEISSIVVPNTVFETSVATVTITSGSASTVTIYVPTVAPVKRDLDHAIRAVSSASNTIPAYASACTDFAEYAAACSSAGVPPGLATVYSTLPAVTTTTIQIVTSTLTTPVTQTVVSDIGITISEASTETTVLSLTETVPTVLTSSRTSYSTSIVGTVTIPVVTTVTVAPTVPVTVSLPIPTFIVKMVPQAAGNPLYLQAKTLDAQSIIGVTDPSVATTYTIDTSNRMYAVSNGWIACGFIPSPNSYYMELVSIASIARFPNYFRPLSCVVDGYKELTCSFGSASNFTIYNNQFFYNKLGANSYPAYRGFIAPV